MNVNLKQKNNSNCNFYHVSLFVPYPNKFLVVCLCILIFHGIYSPAQLQIFFLYWGELISFLEEGARPFSSIKPSMTNHVNLRNSTFLTFSRDFSFQNFLSVQVPIQILKKVFTIVW